MTPHILITRLGGCREVAQAIGRHPARVWRWQDDGIPASNWKALADLAEAKGLPITLEQIANTKPEPREKMKRGPRRADRKA